jgi:exodeoxyribonuclease-5
MLNSFINRAILDEFKHKPTDEQLIVIEKFSEFLKKEEIADKIFLLKGYAGTGKTSLIAALVKSLSKLKIKSVLMAPTGRAAKVLSNYSKKEAFTIHKKIYRQKQSDNFSNFVLDINLNSDTIFIVDEASMIANSSMDNSVFGSGRLLDDLIEFVYNGKNCKLILTGDTAQLPPVKLDISPALEKKELELYGYDVVEFELTEVVRQSSESGILFNATKIRKLIQKSIEHNGKVDFKGFPKITIGNFIDIEKVSGEDLIEKIDNAYRKYSIKEVAVICRSNKRANRFNQGIRNSVLYKEEELSIGDLLMIVKNNYFWTRDFPEIEFIANGDICEIVKIKKYTERYGYRFAEVSLKFSDYNDLEVDSMIMLDTLHTETPSLSYDQNKELYYKIEEDFLQIKNKRKRFTEIREHPFFNAMQVKYAYAITCHKAQGGQWKKVFVDQGFVEQEMINTEYLRWLYTALTRSTTELGLVNFRKEFFFDEDIKDM